MDPFDDDVPDLGHAWPDFRIAALAARQRGLVTRRQLLALGVGRGAIGRALARGRLHQVHRGVYALVPLSALPALAAEHAAILACGPRAWLSHHTAAELLCLCPPDADAGAVDVTVVGENAVRGRSGIRVHQARILDVRDRRREQRLPITAPPRILLELAADTADRQLEQAVDEALSRHLTSRTAIREMLGRYPARPGSARLRSLLSDDRPSSITRSDAEERLLRLIRRSGLPLPEANVSLGRHRPDLLWRSERVVVEFDGYACHSGRRRFEGDRRRDNEMTTAGFQVIRVAWRQLTQEPETVLVWIATALARRA